MKFGLLKTTLLDYPGKVAAVIFTPGCNLRCPYCHNPELVTPKSDEGFLSEEEIQAFLRKRASVLGGVVITGGEPLLHGENIIPLVEEIHSHGLLVKLDTNGLYPDILPRIKADFVAMDLKTSPSRYGELGYGAKDCKEKLSASASFIKESGIEHQFRTTLTESLLNLNDAEDMVPFLTGCQEHRITAFRPGETLSPEWQKKAPPRESFMNTICNFFKNRGIPSYIA